MTACGGFLAAFDAERERKMALLDQAENVECIALSGD